MSLPAAQSAVLGAVEPQDIGRASGAFSTFRQLGGAFGVAVLVAVFAGAGGYGSPQAFSDGFVAAIAACGGLALAAAQSHARLSAFRIFCTGLLAMSRPCSDRLNAINDSSSRRPSSLSVSRNA